KDLIQVAMESEHNDEVFAAAKRLFLTESILSYSFELLNAIEKKLHADELNESSKEKIKILITAAQLNNRINHNTILNKSKEIVDDVYSKQLSIAYRAESMLNSM